MNEKLITIVVILLFITTAIVIISSENANAPKPVNIIQLEHINNGSLYYHTSNYTVTEKYNTSITKTQVYLGDYVNNSVNPDISYNSPNPAIELNYTGNISELTSIIKGYNYFMLSIDGTATFESKTVKLDYQLVAVYDVNPPDLTYTYPVNSPNEVCFYYPSTNSTNLGDFNNISSVNINITPNDNFYNSNNRSIFQSPDLITFSPYVMQYSSDQYYNANNTYTDPTYIISYLIYHYSPSTLVYNVIFNSNTNFNINVNGTNYSSTDNQLVLTFPVGTYSYEYWTNNYSNRSSGAFTIVNKNITINLVTFVTGIVSEVQLGVFILSATSLMFYVINKIRGFLIATVFLTILYVFIGYKLNIVFFNINMLIYVAMILSATLVYKLFME